MRLAELQQALRYQAPIDGVSLRPSGGPGSADVLLFPPRSDAMPNRLAGSAFLVAPAPAARVLEQVQTKALTDWAHPSALPPPLPASSTPGPLREPVRGGLWGPEISRLSGLEMLRAFVERRLAGS